MNKIIRYIFLVNIFLLTTINSFSVSNDGDCYSAHDYDWWKLMICSNEIDKIENVAIQLASDSTVSRNHSFEVKLVHTAIDCLNPEILLILYNNKLGIFDPQIDDIAPFDYLFDENFDKRISYAKDNPLSHVGNLAERLYYTIWTLCGFQPIDENKLLKMRSKLETLIVIE